MLQFDISYETHGEFEEDLLFRIEYIVGDESLDQVLEEAWVGPVEEGTFRFVFQANPPNWDLLPEEDKVGVALVSLKCFYKGAMLVTVGYYVRNSYEDDDAEQPVQADIARLTRTILSEQPRVTVRNGLVPLGSEQ